MTDPRVPPKHDDQPGQAATYNANEWIEVRRRCQIPLVNNEGEGQQPNPHPTQQTIDASQIIGWVHQNGREKPWDGIGMVPAPQTTPVSWYQLQQHNNQHGNYDDQYREYNQGNLPYQRRQGNEAFSTQQDRGNNRYHHAPNPQSTSSTQVEYGSRQSEQGHTSSRR